MRFNTFFLFAVVAVVGCLAILCLLFLFIWYRLRHKAAYYVKEMREIEVLDKGNTKKLSTEERSKPVLVVETAGMEKETLV